MQELCKKLMEQNSILREELKSFVGEKIISGRGNLLVYEKFQQLLKPKLVVFC